MWRNYHFTIVTITYLIGVGCSIYFIGKWLNEFIGFEFGQLLVVIIQIVTFYSLMKVEEYIKQDTINKYIFQYRNDLDS